jgi:hypothetical protein
MIFDIMPITLQLQLDVLWMSPHGQKMKRRKKINIADDEDEDEDQIQNQTQKLILIEQQMSKKI